MLKRISLIIFIVTLFTICLGKNDIDKINIKLPILSNSGLFKGIIFEVKVENKYSGAIDEEIISKIEGTIKKEIIYHKGKINGVPDIKVNIQVSMFKIANSSVNMDCDYSIINLKDNKREIKNRVSVSGRSSINISEAGNQLFDNLLSKIFEDEKYDLLIRNIKRTSSDDNYYILERLVNKLTHEIESKHLSGHNIAILNIQNDLNHYYSNIIANLFINKIDQTKFNIIERENLEKILDEQSLQLSGAVNDEQIVEVGNLSGANYLLIGEINQLGKNKYLKLNLVDTETGEILISKLDALKNL